MTTVAGAPVFTLEGAAALSRSGYGFEAAAAPLPSERDQNFLLLSASGEKRVLKIANPAEDRSCLEMQNAVLDHLGRSGSAPFVPRIVPDLRGRAIGEAVGPDGRTSAVRMVSFIEGTPLGAVRPRTTDLLSDWGRLLGRLTRDLASFDHPAARRPFLWDLLRGFETVREFAPSIASADERVLFDEHLGRIEPLLLPLMDRLPRSVIHNDANDWNVLVTAPDPGPETFGSRRVAGLIDFGDMIHSVTAGEAAVACAYAMLDRDDPLAGAAAVAAGFAAESPLGDLELEALYPMSVLRLLLSAALCARQASLRPDNAYLRISNAAVWDLLRKLRGVHPRWAPYVLRDACGRPAHPDSPRLAAWLKSPERASGREAFAPVLGAPLRETPRIVFDLGIGTPLVGDPRVVDDTAKMTVLLFGEMARRGAEVGIGRYDEPRIIYTAESFRPAGNPLSEGRTVHLGIDLFAREGTPVFAPLDGRVVSARDNAGRQDYGPTIILEHRAEKAGGDEAPLVFHTLYGHLARASLEGLRPGLPVKKGERLAAIGPYPENGDWPPHLHFQILLDLLDGDGNFPGVGRASDRGVWRSLCPDPNAILGLDPAEIALPGLPPGDILAARRERLGPSLSLAYRRPLKIVRGFMTHLYDHTGRLFLDAVNNVPHVGHSHPRVVEAVARQAAVLTTNTRYLHDFLVGYLERLISLLPGPLRVGYLVNSGSEANDLALRLARAFTGRTDMIVLPGGYHGNLSSLIDVSPYKFDSPGGSGCPPGTRVAPMPDLYRGTWRSGDPDAGRKYAAGVRAAAERAAAEGRPAAGFIAESVPSCAGQIVLPDGYLGEAFRHVRAAGGVCIADEVQVGFGRTGSCFWGFETQGAVPDIVTMGKPIGNGFPLAAVVTTRDIADAFAGGMEYFNTFGGSPVACAAGNAVLDVMEEEGLQARAARVGSRLKAGLEDLAERHPCIGDVRGLGLFIGIELVSDREARTPSAAFAAYAAERMREEGILVGTDGPGRNVLKIKPPLCFSIEDADRLAATLDGILGEDPVTWKG